MKLSNKVALITGGSRGIGKGIAKVFSEEGANVVITSKDSTRLQNTTTQLQNTLGISGDVRNEQDVKNIVNQTIEKFGKIDILVNNAGVLPKMKILHEIEESEWKNIIDVNLNGAFRFTKAVIPHMINTGGTIINMSSDAGLKPFENFYGDAYSAAKSALIFLTKVWALEYAKYNIRVNCVCSAVVDTEMTKNLWLSSELKKQKTALEHPLGRIGTVNDVAKAILYFASNDSSWTTGSILTVDGGVAIK